MSKENPTQKELLIRIDERTKNLEQSFKEHREHHLRFRVAGFGALASAITALLVALFRK